MGLKCDPGIFQKPQIGRLFVIEDKRALNKDFGHGAHDQRFIVDPNRRIEVVRFLLSSEVC